MRPKLLWSITAPDPAARAQQMVGTANPQPRRQKAIYRQSGILRETASCFPQRSCLACHMRRTDKIGLRGGATNISRAQEKPSSLTTTTSLQHGCIVALVQGSIVAAPCTAAVQCRTQPSLAGWLLRGRPLLVSPARTPSSTFKQQI
jgi:hypothetical protein